MMRSIAIALGVLVACRSSTDDAKPTRHDEPRPRTDAQAYDPWSPQAHDPWSPTSSFDGVPDLSERIAFANQACPTVTAPYFYRIEKDHHASYILGTRHISVSLAKFPQVVRDRIHDAKLAVFEVAPDDNTRPDYPPLELRDQLGPELWNRFSALVGGISAGSVEHGRPSGALLAMMVMYENVLSMLDSEIEHEVAAAHIPARGLETAMFQDALIDKLLDLRMLRAEVEQTKGRDELKTESTKDLAEYCAGTDETPGMDDKQRDEMLAAGYAQAELDAMDEELVYARNRSWIPKLEPLLANGGVFIAVGADHLIGARGVVALLQGRGYTVTRVK